MSLRVFKTLMLVVFLVAFWLVVVQSAEVQTSQPRYGGELVRAKRLEGFGFDPHTETTFWTHRETELMYNTLVGFDDKMKIVPMLAESWENPDPVTYIFHLRKGAKFCNGREMVAEDVKYSIERIQDPDVPAIGKSHVGPIKAIETPDPYTVVFNLDEPFAPLLTNLASFYIMIVPREVVEENEGSLKTAACGTGPFTLAEHIPGDHILLEGNPDYFLKGRPYLDSIRTLIIPDESTILGQMRARRVDFAQLEDPVVADLAAQEKGLEVKEVSGLAYLYLGINTQRPPFDDVRVRQAISWAIDRQRVIDTVLRGKGTLMGPVPQGLAEWAVSPDSFPSYRTDIAKAKELLAEAGYPDGFKTTITTRTEYPLQYNAALEAQDQLKAIGIDAEVHVVESGAYVRAWKASDFDLIAGQNSGRADPDEYTYFHFHRDGRANIWKLDDPVVNWLTEKGRRTLDLEDRKVIYSLAQERIVEAAPMLFLAAPNLTYVYQDYVKGFTPMPNMQQTYLMETWLEK